MNTTRTDELLGILQRYFNPREEGWLWLAFFQDDDDKGLLNQIEGAYDDAGVAAGALAKIINGCTPSYAYIALCRWDGRPTEADRELWRDLRGSVESPTTLVDMVVFNGDHAWSMREEDAAAAAS